MLEDEEQEVPNEDKPTPDLKDLEENLNSDEEFDVTELLDKDKPSPKDEDDAELSLEDKYAKLEVDFNRANGNGKKWQELMDVIDLPTLDILKGFSKEDQADYVQRMLLPTQVKETPEQTNPDQGGLDLTNNEMVLEQLGTNPVKTLAEVNDRHLQARLPEIIEIVTKQVEAKMEGKYSGLTDRENQIHAKEGWDEVTKWAKDNFGHDVVNDPENPFFKLMDKKVKENPERYRGNPNPAMQAYKDLTVDISIAQRRKRAETNANKQGESPNSGMQGLTKSFFNEPSKRQEDRDALQAEFERNYQDNV